MAAKDAGEEAPLLLNAWSGPAASPAPAAAAVGEGAPLLLSAWSPPPHSVAGSTAALSLAVQASARSEAGVQAGRSGLPRLQRSPSRAAGTAPLHPAGSPWGLTAALLLADMFGIGSLAMPAVFARLGWLVSWAGCGGDAMAIGGMHIMLPMPHSGTPGPQVSFLLLVALGLGCGYLGVLFSKLGVAQAAANTMDEIGSAALGRTGKQLVFACFYTTVVVDPIALHITCMLALQQVSWVWGVGARWGPAAALPPTWQPRPPACRCSRAWARWLPLPASPSSCCRWRRFRCGGEGAAGPQAAGCCSAVGC